MAIAHPTHIVTIGVWCPSTARAETIQSWIQAGPFDDAIEIAALLQHALVELADDVEIVETKQQQHRVAAPPWEQLTLL